MPFLRCPSGPKSALLKNKKQNKSTPPTKLPHIDMNNSQPLNTLIWAKKKKSAAAHEQLQIKENQNREHLFKHWRPNSWMESAGKGPRRLLLLLEGNLTWTFEKKFNLKLTEHQAENFNGTAYVHVYTSIVHYFKM